MQPCSTLPEFLAASPHGALLGLDVGTKTIGVASSDGKRFIATPRLIITRSKWAKEREQLASIIAEYELSGIVVGYPVNMDGTLGPRAQASRDFSRMAGAALGLPVLLWDERLSTAVVDRMMIEADLSRSRRKELVDKLAAAYILQGALDALKSAGWST